MLTAGLLHRMLTGSRMVAEPSLRVLFLEACPGGGRNLLGRLIVRSFALTAGPIAGWNAVEWMIAVENRPHRHDRGRRVVERVADVHRPELTWPSPTSPTT